MTDPAAAVAQLARLPEIEAASERSRTACTELRWHQALRRRTPEAAAESRIRGAWASAELDGARSSVDLVRDLMRGALPRPEHPDPTQRVLQGAIAATAATETLSATVLGSPRQALARLHLAAAAELVPPEQLGRPRDGDDCAEFAGLGAPPPATEIAARLSALEAILTTRGLPAPVVAGLAHAEIAHLRPFTRGNGLVARALDRAVIVASGLDPTGVAVPEAGHGRAGMAAYHGALAAYGQGSRAGLILWFEHCSEAMVAAAREGVTIADAVLAGRLS